jgi:hypothetical protein
MATSSLPRFCSLFFALLVALAGGLSAKPKGSLSDLDIEAAEARMALEKALEENSLLKEQLAISEATAARMSESVALANGEAEVFRRQAGELKLRLEAVGIDGAGGDTSKLEQRLLKAVNDLRLAEEGRRQLTEALLLLSEAVASFVKVAVSPDVEARAALEVQIRKVNELLGNASERIPATSSGTTGTLIDGTVISIKDDLNLIVANVGARQGVQVGMPFQVVRNGHIIGTVRVIDVRDKIAGAAIQNLSSEKERIRVGDRLKVDAQQ